MEPTETSAPPTDANLGSVIAGAIQRLNSLGLLAICAGSVLAFAGSLHWAPDLLGHMRAHFMIAAVVAVLVCIWRRQKFALLCAFACLALNASIVRPWLWIPAQTSPAIERPLKLVCWNTLWSSRRHRQLADKVSDLNADVIVIVEYSTSMAERLDHLRQSHPHYIEHPRDHAFGIAIFSRKPCQLETYLLASGNIPCVRAIFDQEATEPLELWAAHVYPPMGRMWREREKQLQELTALLVNTSGKHVALCGDLNDTPWSRTFRKLTSRTKLEDSRNGKGYHASWPRRLGPLGIPIDHLLTSESVAVTKRKAVFMDKGSDHAALIAELGVRQTD